MNAKFSRELTPMESSVVDSFTFGAELGMQIIHPGGRRSTEQLFELAQFKTGMQVLDAGCGVGTTAIQIASRFGCQVTAFDINPVVVQRAKTNIEAAGLGNSVKAEQGDILALEYPDNTFDRVVIEAVTMFVDRPTALKEVARVCKPGGFVVDHEVFIRQKPPPELVQKITDEGALPVGHLDNLESWVQLYSAAGFEDIEYITEKLTIGPAVIARDEGFINMVKILGRALSRSSSRKRLFGMMRAMRTIRPYVNYMVLRGTKTG